MAPHGTAHGHSRGTHVPVGDRGSSQCVPAHGAEGRGFALRPHVCMLCLPFVWLFHGHSDGAVFFLVYLIHILILPATRKF